MNYDVIIIGGGIGGLMTAYNLRKQNKDIRIAILEKGKMIEDRKCPASQKNGCVKCKSCSITSGYAGAGSFSDGKYNLGTAYGGTLGEELGETLAMQYIQDVESVLDYFTPDANKKYIHTYDTDEELRIKCLQNNLRLLDMKVKHLGTDNNFDIMSALISWLRLNNVELISEFEVEKIEIGVKTFEDMKTRYQIFEKNKGRYYYAEYIVIATGRNGSEFVENTCNNFNIPISSNTVDLGVRVEMKDAIWKHFSDKIYEPKILYKTTRKALYPQSYARQA